MTNLDKIPVLLVDDRPENLTAMKGILEDMGLDIFTASSGNEALRLSLKHDFAIVLMDVRMPEMDGFETAELMRANPKTSRLPIIFVTAAMKDTEHEFKGYGSGAFDYLLKPVEPAILRSKIRVFGDLFQQRRRLEMHEQQLESLVNERTVELNRTVDTLRESERRFRDLLASVTSYMYTVVMDQGRAVSTVHGPGCLAVTGFPAADFAADPGLWYRMILPEDRQAVLNAAQEVMATQVTGTFEHRIQHQDGSIRWVQTTLVPHVSPEGRLLAYDGVITDITARKQAEAEILQLNCELEQRVKERTARLEAVIKELEGFTYTIAHDLRAPLRHIDGYVGLLITRCRAELSEQGQGYVDTIAGSARKMGLLIDDLLDFSRTGRAEIKREKVNMHQTVQEVLDQLKEHCAGRSIEWIVGELPSVEGDGSLLHQVWANLLGNAVKYTRPREAARIEIGTREENGETVFFVADNGVGFDMRYVDKLFGVFQRLHAPEEFEGTGIGLATVCRILTRHGGRIWAEAEVDKGATFFFALPRSI